MHKLKFATLTVAYNEERLIGGMLEGVKNLHNLVMIGLPWYGTHIGFDKTEEIARRMGAEIMNKDFTNETDQRNYGVEYLHSKGYDYVFIFDSDEYLLKSDVEKIIQYVSETKYDSYYLSSAKVYWKTIQYHYIHRGGTTCIKSDKKIVHKRNISKKYKNHPLNKEIILHHFSFSRPDEDIKTKINTRRYSTLNEKWFNEHWKNWTEKSKYKLKNKEIIKTENIPSEILNRYNKSINLFY
jgi:hypothetical protein